MFWNFKTSKISLNILVLTSYNNLLSEGKIMLESLFSLEGQVAVVTGASQGIGKAVAIGLAKAGADVLVNYRSDLAGAEDTARQIEELGKRALIFKANVADRDEVKAMAEKTIAEFGKVDILVNNAGIAKNKAAEEWIMKLGTESLVLTLMVLIIVA
jgi:NAD(P)-dependent dehydrogenase (short-subunit alcohol dehydrogenase family)